MKGLLIYDKVDAGINSWFTDHLCEMGKKYGLELELFICDGRNNDITALKDADFCINRSRFEEYSEFFEKMRKPSFNNSRCIKVANDKWLTYLVGKEAGVPVMPTEELNGSSLPYPFVVKSRNGHGGKEVFWVKDKTDLLSLELTNGSGYIAQSPVSEVGVDVRVYMLGNRPIAGVKRTSDKDFRSNFSLGGKVELFTPTNHMLDVIEKVQKHISADYAGFDFIRHNGEWILNEIEDAVGARMLYSLTDIDIAEEFVRYISEQI